MVPRSRLRSLLLVDEKDPNLATSFSPSKKNKSPAKLSKRQISYQKAQKLLKESQRKVRISNPFHQLSRDLTVIASARIGSWFILVINSNMLLKV